jgi:hypothetical protein
MTIDDKALYEEHPAVDGTKIRAIDYLETSAVDRMDAFLKIKDPRSGKRFYDAIADAVYARLFK